MATCFVFLMLAAPAQADEVDLFQDLDTAMASSAEKEIAQASDVGILSQIKSNMDLSVRLRGTHFLQTAGTDRLPKDTQDNQGEARVNFATSAATEQFRMVTSGWLETGNQNDTYDGVTEFFQDNDRRRNFLEINEIYGTADFGDIELTMGRKILNNGVSTLFSPANRFSPLDLNDPMDPRRLGVWQAGLDLIDADTTWTFIVMPYFIPPKTPSPKSRWVSGDAWGGIPGYFGSSQSLFDDYLEVLHFFSELAGRDLVPLFEQLFDTSFGGAVPLTTTKYELPDSDDPDQWGYFGRVKSSVGRYDMFASAFRGPSMYPVLKATLDSAAPAVLITVEHPIADQIAGGASTTWNELEFHTEALYSHTEDNKDDSYLNFVVGSTWSNQSYAQRMKMHRIDLTAEYVGESITNRQSADGYFISSRDARLGRNDAVLRADVHLTEDFSVQYVADIVLSNSARMNRFGTTWRLREGLTWKTGLELFDGSNNSYYGRWRDQDRVVTSIEYAF